jgi:putative endonuclease
MEKHYYTYTMASKVYGTLYVGVTNNLLKRTYEHKNGLVKGFTKRYNVNKLVYYEECTDINAAIYREKQIKKWNRQWKINLIEKLNPQWQDLYDSLLFGRCLE